VWVGLAWTVATHTAFSALLAEVPPPRTKLTWKC
jgi:hypothetical protein